MKKFPFYKQETNYTCGAAVMRMALEYFGIKKSEKQIAKLLGTNRTRGTWHKDLPILAEKFKLNYVVMRQAKISDLKWYQKNHFIVVLCYFNRQEKIDHYAIVKKIDKKYIYFYDPYFGDQHKHLLKYFEKIWKFDSKYDKEKHWFLAIKK